MIENGWSMNSNVMTKNVYMVVCKVNLIKSKHKVTVAHYQKELVAAFLLQILEFQNII